MTIKISCFDKSRIPEHFEQIIYDYLFDKLYITQFKAIDKEFASRQQAEVDGTMLYEYILNEQLIEKLNKDIEL